MAHAGDERPCVIRDDQFGRCDAGGAGGDSACEADGVVAPTLLVAAGGVRGAQEPAADTGPAQDEPRPLPVRKRQRRLRCGRGERTIRDRHPQAAAPGAPPEERGQQGELREVVQERAFVHETPPRLHDTRGGPAAR